MICWRALLTPVYMRRMLVGCDRDGWTPYAELFVFGIRIVRWGLAQ